MKMTMMDWKRIGAISGILGGILFVIITIIDMLIYPGGYSFVDNSFSQLGLTVINGVPTFLNYVLFALACTATAVCTIPFWLAIRTEFSEPSKVKHIGLIGTIAGITAAPFLSALGIFAADIFPYPHGFSTILFFILYASAIIIYSIGILVNKEYNSLLAIVGFFAAAMAFLYILVIGGALMQKITVYSFIAWSGFQGYYMLKKME
ncbi:MAG: hypothetical protein ACTSUO_01070 [Candidatus Thorarchaeota archaeon]